VVVETMFSKVMHLVLKFKFCNQIIGAVFIQVFNFLSCKQSYDVIEQLMFKMMITKLILKTNPNNMNYVLSISSLV